MVYMDTIVGAWNAPIRANYEFVCYANYGVRPTGIATPSSCARGAMSWP